jgi:hypothetical protein
MSIRVGRIEVDNEVAAPDLPETKVTLVPAPPRGWERGLPSSSEDIPGVVFTLVDDKVSFRCPPEIRDRVIEALEEHVGAANHAYAMATAAATGSLRVPGSR